MGVGEGVLRREVSEQLLVKATWGGLELLRRGRAGGSAGREQLG